MYMPGRRRMWAASLRTLMFFSLYSSDASFNSASSATCSAGAVGIVSLLISASSPVVATRGPRVGSVSPQSGGAEAQVGQGGVRQAAAQGLQQPAFVEVGQLLQQHGVAH